MKFFGALTARRLLGLTLILLLILANAIVSYRSVRRVALNNQRVLKTTQIIAEMQGLLSTMQNAEAGQRGYIITGRDDYLEPYNEALIEVGTHQKTLRSLVEDPIVAQQLPQLDKQIDGRLSSLKETIALRRTRGLEAAQARIVTGEGKRKMDEIHRTVESMNARERILLEDGKEQSNQSVRLGQLAFVVALGLNLLFLSGFYLLNRREETRREKAAAQLKISNDRFSSIVSASSNIIWATNASGEFVEAQPSWSAFTGNDFQTYRGVGWIDAIHPDDSARVLKEWKQALAQQKFYSIEYRMLRHDGRWRTMAVRATPMRDERGEIYEWVGTSTDITDAQATQRELAQSRRTPANGDVQRADDPVHRR